MKILQVVASYKPAFVYGGPVMSVAKLCEELEGGRGNEGEKLNAESGRRRLESRKSGDGSPLVDGERWMTKGVESGKWELESEEVAVTVYTTLANGKEELPYQNGEVRDVDGVEVHYFKRLTKDHSHLSLALYWQLLKTIRQFDIIHIHAWWNLVSMPVCLIAFLFRKKMILTPRGTLSSYSFQVNNSRFKKLFHQLLGKSILNYCYFHTTSKKESIDTQNLLNPKKIYTLPNFVSLPWDQDFHRQKNSETDTLKLIFLSRVEQKKGLELLFDALANCNFNWSLSIVGSGESEYVESLKFKAQSLKLTDRINWLGAVYGKEKFEILAQHDFFILPSFDENFANVVIESIYCGTPVLITKNVGLSDYVSDHQLGYVFNRDLHSLFEALQQASKTHNKTDFRPDILNQKIRKDFNEDYLRQGYLKMYSEVAGNM